MSISKTAGVNPIEGMREGRCRVARGTVRLAVETRFVNPQLSSIRRLVRPTPFAKGPTHPPNTLRRLD